MTLADFSTEQLYRLYHRIWSTIPDGGCYGWDVPTLRAVYPSKAAALRAIAIEVRSRG